LYVEDGARAFLLLDDVIVAALSGARRTTIAAESAILHFAAFVGGDQCLVEEHIASLVSFDFLGIGSCRYPIWEHFTGQFLFQKLLLWRVLLVEQ